MDNLFAFVVSLASIFIILTIASGWTWSINAQNDSSRITHHLDQIQHLKVMAHQS